MPVYPDTLITSEEVAIESSDVGKSSAVKGGHSMTLFSHRNLPIEINVTSKAPKRDTISDGKRIVTGNTRVKRRPSQSAY